MTHAVTGALRSEFAPTGRLRVGINYGNFLLVLNDATDGTPQGIAPDLARELGRRIGVPVEFVRFDQAGKMAQAVTTGAWDIAFLAAEPARANVIAFTAAYLEIEATYLVPPGSPIRTIDDVDRPGVRIAVADKAAYDLYLSRTLKHAELVRAEGIPGSYDLFVAQKLDVLSGLKPRLLMDVEKLPGARILDGRFTAIQQGIGTPVARAQAAGYLREFVEDAKSSGLVAQAIARHGVRGVNVAPPVY
jgi:polar amino acid transport system substrate-binding protein